MSTSLSTAVAIPLTPAERVSAPAVPTTAMRSAASPRFATTSISGVLLSAVAPGPKNASDSSTVRRSAVPAVPVTSTVSVFVAVAPAHGMGTAPKRRIPPALTLSVAWPAGGMAAETALVAGLYAHASGVPPVYCAVYVAEELVVSWCTRAPPSDHEPNVNSTPPSTCVAGADTVCVEPVMTVRVNGAAAVSSSTVSCRPGDARCEGCLHGLRLQHHRLHVLETAAVGDGQPQLEVRRVVVVGRVERRRS